MTERACLRLTQDGRCRTCGSAPQVTERSRDGRLLLESVCAACNACRIDPKELLQEQAAGDTPLELLTQTGKTI